MYNIIVKVGKNAFLLSTMVLFSTGISLAADSPDWWRDPFMDTPNLIVEKGSASGISSEASALEKAVENALDEIINRRITEENLRSHVEWPVLGEDVIDEQYIIEDAQGMWHAWVLLRLSILKFEIVKDEAKKSLEREVEQERIFASGTEHYEVGEYNKAIEEFERLLELNPGRRDAQEKKRKAEKELEDKMFSEGVKCLEDSKYEEAIEFFMDVLELNPGRRDVQPLLTKARQGIEKAKEDEIFERGRRHYTFGRYDKAINEFRRLLRINTRRDDARRMMNRAQAEIDREEKERRERAERKRRDERRRERAMSASRLFFQYWMREVEDAPGSGEINTYALKFEPGYDRSGMTLDIQYGSPEGDDLHLISLGSDILINIFYSVSVSIGYNYMFFHHSDSMDIERHAVLYGLRAGFPIPKIGVLVFGSWKKEAWADTNISGEDPDKDDFREIGLSWQFPDSSWGISVAHRKESPRIFGEGSGVVASLVYHW